MEFKFKPDLIRYVDLKFKQIESLDLGETPDSPEVDTKAEAIVALDPELKDFHDLNRLIKKANVLIELLNSLESSFHILSRPEIYAIDSIQKLLEDFNSERNRLALLLDKREYDDFEDPVFLSRCLDRARETMESVLCDLRRIYAEAKKVAYKRPTSSYSFKDFEDGSVTLPTLSNFGTNLGRADKPKTFKDSFPSLGKVINLSELDKLSKKFEKQKKSLTKIYVTQNDDPNAELSIPQSWIPPLTSTAIAFAETKALMWAILRQENLETSLGYNQPMHDDKVFERFLRLRNSLTCLKSDLDEIDRCYTELIMVDSPCYLNTIKSATEATDRMRKYRK